MQCSKSARLLNKNKTLKTIESEAQITLNNQPDVTWATCHKGKPTDPIQTDTAANLNFVRVVLNAAVSIKPQTVEEII